MNCPKNGGALVRFECVNSASLSGNTETYLFNDRLTSVSWNPIDYCKGSDFTPTTTTVSRTYVNPITSTSTTYTIYMNQVTFLTNTYTENFATGGKGLVDVWASPRVVFSGETFTGNGDATVDSITKYGSGVISVDTSVDSTIA